MTGQRYRLEFIVKAGDWQSVVEIFKDEFDIDSDKQDASYREIDGMFIVQVWVDKSRLNGDFYGKVNESSSTALSYDPSNKDIRNAIMDRVCIVEHDLRKLLLNISDIVEDYFKIYDNTNAAKVYRKNRDTVRKGDINPITSHLTLEDEIRIFSIELSPWYEKPLTAADLLELLDASSELEKVKSTLRQKTMSHTVWDDVDEHILKTGKKWEDILPVLTEIKDIRNKAAHFRVVTQSDLERVKTLSLSLKDTIAPKRTSTEQDLQELHRSINEKLGAVSGLDVQLAELTKTINRMNTERMQSIAESALGTQKAMLENLKLNTGLVDSLKVSETIAKRFFDNSNLDAILRAQTAALVSLPKINFPALNISQSTINSVLGAQRALGSIDTALQNDGGNGPSDTSDNDTNDGAANNRQSADDDSQPPKSSPSSKKGKKE
ncbi:MAG TPA: hypothetical protein PKD19_03600 [Candidatus Saccharibacteria bacterium]|nr:hypothetical protein [Candidatus Saccharibacteria bacterium]